MAGALDNVSDEPLATCGGVPERYPHRVVVVESAERSSDGRLSNVCERMERQTMLPDRVENGPGGWPSQA